MHQALELVRKATGIINQIEFLLLAYGMRTQQVTWNGSAFIHKVHCRGMGVFLHYELSFKTSGEHPLMRPFVQVHLQDQDKFLGWSYDVEYDRVYLYYDETGPDHHTGACDLSLIQNSETKEIGKESAFLTLQEAFCHIRECYYEDL